MRFTIEQRLLTDMSGKPLAGASAAAFHTLEAGDPDDAVRLFARHHGAEILGDVLKFPGFQAVATLRNSAGVYTIQVTPASQPP